MVQFYGNITKVDAEQRMVWGYASTEAVDSDGEVIKRSAISEALEDYMKFANIREMHQPSAVGIAKEAFTDEKGLYIAAKVVDDDAWAKVAAGVYKGFSIGGKVLERDPVARKTITKVGLYEISLVDRPANPEATFDVWKVADPSKESGMKLEDLEKAEALALGKTADADALAKAEADAAVLAKAEAVAVAAIKAAAIESVVVIDKAAADKYGAYKLAADEFIADRVAKGDKVAEATSAMDPDARILWVAAELSDPVAKAEAALAELIAVVDAHTAPVVALNKFDAAMAALVALGDVGAPVVDLFKAAKVEADEALTKAAGVSGEPMKGVVPEADLAKALADLAVRDEAFAKMTDGMTALTKRMSALEVLPLPPKTLGAGAVALVVEKGADAAGGVSREVAAPGVSLDADSVKKYLDSLDENERAFQIMKAAQAHPISILR